MLFRGRGHLCVHKGSKALLTPCRCLCCCREQGNPLEHQRSLSCCFCSKWQFVQQRESEVFPCPWLTGTFPTAHSPPPSTLDHWGNIEHLIFRDTVRAPAWAQTVDMEQQMNSLRLLVSLAHQKGTSDFCGMRTRGLVSSGTNGRGLHFGWCFHGLQVLQSCHNTS